MTRFRLATALVLAVLASMTAAPASAIDPTGRTAAGIEDDVLQITLNRLVAEAPDFGEFATCEGIVNPCDVGTNAQISVIRLDNGEHAEVNGETAQVSLSSVKALWVVMAVGEVGIEAVEPQAPAIFEVSDDNAAGEVIDLLGDPPSDGIDIINATTASWGLTDTWLRGWYDGRAASEPYPEGMGVWGRNNYTTTDDLATFWVMLNRGDLLGPEGTAQVLEWAALPRPWQGNELITNRLPAAVAAEVAHKTGWSDAGSNRRIDGGLVTTPDGITYAIAVAFKAGSESSFLGGAADWAHYASCEVYNVIAGTEHTCTRTGDPYEIINHTTAPIGALSSASAVRDRVIVGGWALDRDLDADPVIVRITVDGNRLGAFRAGSLQTAVHDETGMGNYHGFDVVLDANLSPGRHQVCAAALNDSPIGADKAIGCRDVTVPEDWPPIGSLNSAFVDDGKIVARGWASDPDTTDPIEVEILVDGTSAAGVAADGGLGGQRFRAVLPAPPTAGEHTVCAVALNYEDAGPDRNIGCRVVKVPADSPPMGSLKSASADTGEIIARGWASDPDAADPIEVKILVDGTWTAKVRADRGASDDWFRAVLPAPPTAGEHMVCAVALNYGGAPPNGKIGCRVVEIPSDWPPTGSLESAFADAGRIIARGWASDPDTAEPIDVGIRLDGIPILRVTADRGPSGHLFRAVTPSLLPGGYEVCAIAFNHTGGDPTTPLGCAAVVVTDP